MWSSILSTQLIHTWVFFSTFSLLYNSITTCGLQLKMEWLWFNQNLSVSDWKMGDSFQLSGKENNPWNIWKMKPLSVFAMPAYLVIRDSFCMIQQLSLKIKQLILHRQEKNDQKPLPVLFLNGAHENQCGVTALCWACDHPLLPHLLCSEAWFYHLLYCPREPETESSKYICFRNLYEMWKSNATAKRFWSAERINLPTHYIYWFKSSFRTSA